VTRFLDSLAATLTGILIGVALVAAIAPGAWTPTPRPARVAPTLSGHLGRSGQPESHPGAHRTGSPGRITHPRPAIGMRPAPTEAPRTAITLRGTATWFVSPAGVSAAGPDLRAALGPGWRGSSVRVCAASGCVVTTLGDWMRADRLIDLHAPLFARLAPLSRGVLAVTVTVIPAPPVTSTR
jgi:hypothetical protein